MLQKNSERFAMGVKATVILNDAIWNEAQEVVKKRRFKSMKALIETALQDELEKIRREEIAEAIRQAAEDPLFLADVTETTEYYTHVDTERIEE
jgi:Arc/MetJ-type ribon-helix-helix transcriptional regulator